MDNEQLKRVVQDIVAQADRIKRTIVTASAPVNYACIFCQSENEYASFLGAAKSLGTVVQETNAGPVFQIDPLPTVAGDLRLLKIRKPDPTRTERGDADFTLANYDELKKEHINQEGFQIIDRGDFEMIEYKAPDANVLLYFSHPTLGQVLGIEE